MKFILSFTFLTLLIFQVNSQNWSSDEYQYNELYPGYIMTLEGEKILGFIKYRNRVVMQDEVVFYTDKNNSRTKTTYDPKDLKEYEVAEMHYDCIQYSGGKMSNSTKALLLKNSACISEYTWYERSDQYNRLLQGDGESDEDFAKRKYPETAVYYQEGQLPVPLIYFKDDYSKKMSQYLGNNKEISSRVKKAKEDFSEFKAKGVIDEYNKACK